MTSVLVVGAEGTGTRLMTKVLIGSGFEGSAEHSQPFDLMIPPGRSPIVWRRSYPHGGAVPDANGIIRGWPSLKSLSMRVWLSGRLHQHVLVMMRDPYAVSQSQVKSGVAASIPEAYQQIRDAYLRIFNDITNVQLPYTLVMYSALVNSMNTTLAYLSECVGQQLHYEGELYDGDSKYR
jgi:hypothetical protein